MTITTETVAAVAWGKRSRRRAAAPLPVPFSRRSAAFHGDPLPDAQEAALTASRRDPRQLTLPLPEPPESLPRLAMQVGRISRPES